MFHQRGLRPSYLEIRMEVRRRLEREKKSKDLVSPDSSPLYDEIFFKGLAKDWPIKNCCPSKPDMMLQN